LRQLRSPIWLRPLRLGRGPDLRPPGRLRPPRLRVGPGDPGAKACGLVIIQVKLVDSFGLDAMPALGWRLGARLAPALRPQTTEGAKACGLFLLLFLDSRGRSHRACGPLIPRAVPKDPM
jgi:hypothetical protein